jgi:hypothetical protein
MWPNQENNRKNSANSSINTCINQCDSMNSLHVHVSKTHTKYCLPCLPYVNDWQKKLCKIGHWKNILSQVKSINLENKMKEIKYDIGKVQLIKVIMPAYAIIGKYTLFPFVI